MAAVDYCIAYGAYVGHGYVNVVGVVGAVFHAGFASLADACTYPLARVEGLEGADYLVQVGHGVFVAQVLPVAGLGLRLLKVAVLYKDYVSVEIGGELIVVARSGGIAGAVAFGNY